MSKVEVGDLVRMKEPKTSFWLVRFRVVREEERFVEIRDLKGKTGIVVLKVEDDGEDYLADGVYHVAFSDIVIQAYHDYFEKV